MGVVGVVNYKKCDLPPSMIIKDLGQHKIHPYGAGAYSVTLSVIPSFRPSVLPISVSAHYPSHTLRFSNEIWSIGLSQEYAG